jgi:hypothetical protein
MIERKKRWLSLSLRSLLIVVTIVVAILGLWTRARHFRNLAASHHFKAMDAGYQAAAIQRPVDLHWEWKFPAQTKMDCATIAEAAPYWQASMYHAELRDIYLDAAQYPWLPITQIPAYPSPVVVPNENNLAEEWWKETFGMYIESNQCLLESHMGFPANDDRNLKYAQTLLTNEQLASLQTRFRERRGIVIAHE